MTNITLAKNLDNFVYYTNVIEGTKHVDLQAVDFEFADYFLIQLKIDREVSNEFQDIDIIYAQHMDTVEDNIH